MNILKNKQKKISKAAEKKLVFPTKDVLEIFFDKDPYDDHGPVIIGDRKSKPKF